MGRGSRVLFIGALAACSRSSDSDLRLRKETVRKLDAGADAAGAQPATDAGPPRHTPVTHQAPNHSPPTNLPPKPPPPMKPGR